MERVAACQRLHLTFKMYLEATNAPLARVVVTHKNLKGSPLYRAAASLGLIKPMVCVTSFPPRAPHMLWRLFGAGLLRTTEIPPGVTEGTSHRADVLPTHGASALVLVIEKIEVFFAPLDDNILIVGLTGYIGALAYTMRFGSMTRLD